MLLYYCHYEDSMRNHKIRYYEKICYSNHANVILLAASPIGTTALWNNKGELVYEEQHTGQGGFFQYLFTS